MEDMAMVNEALGAWIHFLSIFAAVGFLGAEIATYRPEMSTAVMQRLRRLDAGYGLAATAIIVTGLLRVFFFGKGADYYAHNHIFWTKMALVVVVILLSIPPTIHFLRIARQSAGDIVRVEARLFSRNRRFLLAEAGLFLLIPLMATLMARGIGYAG
jgi:putative membrane protein